MLSLRGGRTIRRNNDPEIAKEGVGGCEEHAHVGSEAGQNHAASFEIVQEEIELGVVESRVLRLEDEVVVLIGLKQLRDRLAAHAILQRVTQLLAQIGAPFSEVVVDVYHR